MIIPSIFGLVRALVAAGADVNKATGDGNAPLHFASMAGHTMVVVILLAARPCASIKQRNDARETPLLVARRFGHATAVRVLESEGLRHLKRLWMMKIQ